MGSPILFDSHKGRAVTAEEGRLLSPFSEVEEKNEGSSSSLTLPFTVAHEVGSPVNLSPRYSIKVSCELHRFLPSCDLADIDLRLLGKASKVAMLGVVNKTFKYPINCFKDPELIKLFQLDPGSTKTIHLLGEKFSNASIHCPIIFKQAGLHILAQIFSKNLDIRLSVFSSEIEIILFLEKIIARKERQPFGFLVTDMLAKKDPYITPVVVLYPEGKPLQIVSLDPLNCPKEELLGAIDILCKKGIAIDFIQPSEPFIEKERHNQVFSLFTSAMALLDLKTNSIHDMEEVLKIDEEERTYRLPIRWSLAKGRSLMEFSEGSSVEDIHLLENMVFLRRHYLEKMRVKRLFGVRHLKSEDKTLEKIKFLARSIDWVDTYYLKSSYDLFHVLKNALNL